MLPKILCLYSEVMEVIQSLTHEPNVIQPQGLLAGTTRSERLGEFPFQNTVY